MTTIRTSKEIGFKLKRLREQTGISQEKMAELIGVSRGQLQKYESGKNLMNTEKLQLVADALSVLVQELFVDGEEVVPMSVMERQLLDSYRAIPNKEVQKSILKITTNATKQSE